MSLRQRSNWWFLLPIFLNIAGGVIAYFVLRHDDSQKAKNCLILGAVLLAISMVLGLAIPAAEPESTRDRDSIPESPSVNTNLGPAETDKIEAGAREVAERLLAVEQQREYQFELALNRITAETEDLTSELLEEAAFCLQQQCPASLVAITINQLDTVNEEILRMCIEAGEQVVDDADFVYETCLDTRWELITEESNEIVHALLRLYGAELLAQEKQLGSLCAEDTACGSLMWALRQGG